ncbi:MAG: hypothetical protein ABI345_11330 [Jatrophihabitans sp.]
MTTFLLVLIGAMAMIAIGLLVAASKRNDSMLALLGLAVTLAAGFPTLVYAGFTSA